MPVGTCYFKTGIYQMDYVCAGGKGIPDGSMIEITSDAGLGKTTLVLDCIKRILDSTEDTCGLYIDSEQGLNDDILSNLGLDGYIGKIEEGGRLQIEYWNTHQEIDEKLFKMDEDGKAKKDDGLVTRLKGKINFIVVDSITAVIPKTVLYGNIEKVRPGIKAERDSGLLLKFKAITKPWGITSFWVNQQRWRLNFRFPNATKLVSSGGKAFEFYTDIRLLMKRMNKLHKVIDTVEGKQEVEIGAINKIYAFKNKYTEPYVNYSVPIVYGKGVSEVLGYDILLEKYGYKKQSGAWYTIVVNGEELVKTHGESKLREWIKDNKVMVKELVEKEIIKYSKEKQGR